MKLSVNAGHFTACPSGEERTLKESIVLVKKAGFDFIDLSVMKSNTPEEVAEIVRSNGIRVNQFHAPFNRYKREDAEVFKENLISGIKNAKILGAPIYVVHGDEFDFSKTWSREAAIEYNYRLFYPVIEFAAKNNMRVAFENVFEDDPEARPRLCSSTEDLIELTEKFDRKYTGICWDFGHAKVQYPNDYTAQLEKVIDRVIATHVHDNYYGKDLHLFPFLGDTDWAENMRILKSAGYKGELTFEFVYDRIPSELLGDYLAILFKTGNYLSNM